MEEKPECVVATGREEKVDVWAKNPAKSVVLTIKGDLRFIRNNVFATAYSVRFPKVHNVRTDKGGLDIETHEKIILDARAAPKSVLVSRSRDGSGIVPVGVIP